jgi:hypothetical protein
MSLCSGKCVDYTAAMARIMINNTSNDLIPISSLDFSIYLMFPAALRSWSSSSNRYEYLESSSEDKAWQAHKAENLTAICEPNA